MGVVGGAHAAKITIPHGAFFGARPQMTASGRYVWPITIYKNSLKSMRSHACGRSIPCVIVDVDMESPSGGTD
jgi:hypothetical protein